MDGANSSNRYSPASVNVASLELAAGDATATVQLFRDVAPNTCEAILSRLPLEGRLTHAKNCDGEVIFMLPFIFDGHENLTVPKPGFLFVWRYTLCIWYGPTTIEPLPNSFGRITSNLAGFSQVAEPVWARQGLHVRLSNSGAEC